MAAPISTKLVMKNTTKMSLNERFTVYRNEIRNHSTQQKVILQRQTNSANLRLAQQMANRPSVIAALRLKKRSIQQRLGGKSQATGGIKSRLTLSRNIANQQPRRGSFRGRRGQNRNQGMKSGTSPMLRARLGTGRAGNFNTPIKSYQQLKFGGRRGNFQGGNRRFPAGNRQPRGQNTNRGRRGGRGRGGWRFSAKQPTRQELDNDLDAYMAETKTG